MAVDQVQGMRRSVERISAGEHTLLDPRFVKDVAPRLADTEDGWDVGLEGGTEGVVEEERFSCKFGLNIRSG